MSLFFLTGLPRNRTAWLSVLLSHGSTSFCTHDGLKNHSPKQLVHAMRESDYDYAGDSDSALLLHVEEIVSLVPDANWVLLHRDVVDCLDSYHRHFEFKYPGGPKTYPELVNTFNVAEKLFQRTKRILPRALTVNFSELDNIAVVYKLWRHCMPGVLFPVNRFNELSALRVNVMVEKLKGPK